VVGNGKQPRFWHEVWLGKCHLKIRFNRLFEICKQQNWAVARVLQGGVINLTFRRNFGEAEILEWEELDQVQLTDAEDSFKWALTSHGQFTTSFYMHCALSGVVDVRMEEL
jgi:hypothetical protein